MLMRCNETISGVNHTLGLHCGEDQRIACVGRGDLCVLRDVLVHRLAMFDRDDGNIDPVSSAGNDLD